MLHKVSWTFSRKQVRCLLNAVYIAQLIFYMNQSLTSKRTLLLA